MVTGSFVSVAAKGDTGLGGSGEGRDGAGTSCRTLGAADTWRNSGTLATGFKKGKQAEACSTPPCFLQEWQTKDLRMGWRVRVANAGLNVVVLSWSCEESVRVARKGLTAGETGARREYRDEGIVGQGQPLQITKHITMI